MQAFKAGLSVETGEALPVDEYRALAKNIDGLADAVADLTKERRPAVRAAAIEFLLEGLHLNKRLNKDDVGGQIRYRG